MFYKFNVDLMGQGLVKLEAETKRYEILATRVSEGSGIDPGTPLNYVNDLDISHRDGTVYFTDSGGLSPIKNRAGFWDTMAGFLLVTFQVQGCFPAGVFFRCAPPVLP